MPARGRDAADPDDGDEAGGRDGDDGNADTDAGGAVHVRIVADDLVALRAGIRSWSRLITVAEQLTAE
ncbi:MAG: KEOPS complex subunit Pcc1 [Halorubrum sp.]